MINIGIMSYNIYCNFTNYGSALQTYAMNCILSNISDKIHVKLIDYCPDILANLNPLDPFKDMWDKDESYRSKCEESLPAIKINYEKFVHFYNYYFDKTNKYTSANFNEIVLSEGISHFVCGSDTIFCIDEFGFDDGYYANYSCMKDHSIAFAASFGDAEFDEDNKRVLKDRLNNFKFLGIRESRLIPLIKSLTKVPVCRVIDPTLLIDFTDLDSLACDRLFDYEYVLLYSRRENSEMTVFASQIAQSEGLKIIEISLNAEHAKHHQMFYEAGVEEFLSLVKYAKRVVTNSYHGLIMALRYRTPVTVYSREQSSNKIRELVRVLDEDLIFNNTITIESNQFEKIELNLAAYKEKSLSVLRQEVLRLVGLNE